MIWKVKPFVLGIVLLFVEFAFLVALVISTKSFGEPFTWISMFLFMLPCIPLTIVALIGGIKRLRNEETRNEGISTTIVAVSAIVFYIIVVALIIFVLATGGRLPHEIFY